jgi:hypothetical protein
MGNFDYNFYVIKHRSSKHMGGIIIGRRFRSAELTHLKRNSCKGRYSFVLRSCHIIVQLVLFVTVIVENSLFWEKTQYSTEDRLMSRIKISRNSFLWDVTPYGSCKNRRFGGT